MDSGQCPAGKPVVFQAALNFEGDNSPHICLHQMSRGTHQREDRFTDDNGDGDNGVCRRDGN